jgi:transposase-like protein
MVERDGKLVAKKVKSTSAEYLTPEIIKTIKEAATLYTDEWGVYRGLDRLYNHLFVKHNSGEYVNGNIYTNTIEGFWSLLKRGIVGIYHFVSRKHLQYYVDEFVFRYNTRKFDTEKARFDYFLTAISSKYLPYKTLIAAA